MSTRYDAGQVREFWTAQAVEHRQSPAASWSDQMVIEMEIREMAGRLDAGDRVLDVGCANGFSTVQYAREKGIQIRGIDYIPEMIAHASERLREVASELTGKVEFAVGDILNLDEATASFDKLIVTRVIINLDSWDKQVRGLEECARVLKPGGLLLLSEATVQGWARLNEFRAEWGLPPIPMPPFNLYVDQVKIVDFASSYYVGTRVLKPLLAAALGLSDRIADPNMHWNRWMSAVPAIGDYGTQKLFVFRRH